MNLIIKEVIAIYRNNSKYKSKQKRFSMMISKINIWKSWNELLIAIASSLLLLLLLLLFCKIYSFLIITVFASH
jgi:hypothetical protein